MSHLKPSTGPVKRTRSKKDVVPRKQARIMKPIMQRSTSFMSSASSATTLEAAVCEGPAPDDGLTSKGTSKDRSGNNNVLKGLCAAGMTEEEARRALSAIQHGLASENEGMPNDGTWGKLCDHVRAREFKSIKDTCFFAAFSKISSNTDKWRVCTECFAERGNSWGLSDTVFLFNCNFCPCCGHM